MVLRTDDLHVPFMQALHAIGYPAELSEIADWINANMPLARGPVKNNGTLGRTRDELERAKLIERDVTSSRRYRPLQVKVKEESAAILPIQSNTTIATRNLRESVEPERLDERGMRRQTLYLPPSVYEQIRDTCFHQRKTQQAFFREAFELYFQHHGMKSWAELTKADKAVEKQKKNGA